MVTLVTGSGIIVTGAEAASPLDESRIEGYGFAGEVSIGFEEVIGFAGRLAAPVTKARLGEGGTGSDC